MAATQRPLNGAAETEKSGPRRGPRSRRGTWSRPRTKRSRLPRSASWRSELMRRRSKSSRPTRHDLPPGRGDSPHPRGRSRGQLNPGPVPGWPPPRAHASRGVPSQPLGPMASAGRCATCFHHRRGLSAGLGQAPPTRGLRVPRWTRQSNSRRTCIVAAAALRPRRGEAGPRGEAAIDVSGGS
jgi:hypothetical protein